MMKNQYKKACTVCGKIGHKGSDCFSLAKNKVKKEDWYNKIKRNKNKKYNNRNQNQKGKWKSNNKNADQRNNDDIAMSGIDEEMTFIAKDTQKFNKHTWIADSGATVHMCNDIDGMFDLEDANITISVGDGRKMTTMKVGKYRGTIIDAEGRKTKITLTNVSYVPELMVNLFSLTAVMEKNCSVIGTKNGIVLEKGNWKANFNVRFGTPKGHVFGATIIPENNNEMGQVNLRQRLDYERAHQILGHPGRNKLIGTTERLDWHLNEKHAENCEDCLKGKARRLNVNKISKNQSKNPGERIMIDISSVKTKNNKKVGRFWLLVVDEATDMKWSFFLKKKSDQVKLLLGFEKI